jgi:hypothetical protein
MDDCLIIPLAAQSINSIEQFVGNIIEKPKDDKWCYVDFMPLSNPNNLEAWNHARSQLINEKLPCWYGSIIRIIEIAIKSVFLI